MRWVIALTAGALIVSLPAQGAQQSESTTLTIRLISTTTQYKLLKDGVPKGELDKGDVLWAKSTLRNGVPQFGKPKGAIVGSDVFTARVISAVKTTLTFDVKITARLPGGTLRSAGRIYQERVERVPVIGGTGDFAGARGVTETYPLNESGSKTRNIYRLRIP